jgi:hypothetical protein
MRGTFIFFLLFGLGNAAHAGEIFRCVGTNGAVSFTNMACPANSKVEHFSSYTPVPDAPIPAYSKPSFAPAVSAQPSIVQANAAYQAGYERALADEQNDPSRDEGDYAAGWIPFYPVHRALSRDHHHHPRKTMSVQAPSHTRSIAIRGTH